MDSKPLSVKLTAILFIFFFLACYTGGCGEEEDKNGSKDGGDTKDAAPDDDDVKGNDDDNNDDGGNAIGSDNFSIAFNFEQKEFSLIRGDKTLLYFPAEGLQIGTVRRIEDNLNYDPWPLVTNDALYTEPNGLEWSSVSRIEVVSIENNKAEFLIMFTDSSEAALTAEVALEGGFKLKLTPLREETPIAFFRLNPRIDSQEGLYGLGEYFDDVNHRGKIRAMQIEVDGKLESGYNEAHVPVPFVTGLNGWGLFVENPYPATFDCATQSDDLLQVTFGVGAGAKNGFLFHLFAAHHPLDITKHYYEATGYPKLPARWALGPIIWRDENRDQAEVESDIEIMRELDLPANAYWIDRPYASCVNTFDFHPQQFTDPEAMIKKMHRLGYRIALWHTPYVSKDCDKALELLAYAEEQSFFPPKKGINFNKWGTPLDFTNPAAYEWWQGLIRLYTDIGIEGFKLDYGEDIVPGIAGKRNYWEFYDGSNELTMHWGYQHLYHKVYSDLMPKEGGFILSRGGGYGDQVYTNVIWPGDLDADLVFHGEEVVNRKGQKYNAVGGLPAAVIASQTLGPSGYPFFGSDTGGYRHSPPDKETFTRWFQHTALSSVMQIGTSTNDVAWEYNETNGFDDEMLGWYRIYTKLHIRLWPYEWTYAQNILKDGRPIQRSLGLQYPELGVHPWDTYMFGDDLLVAPIVRRGQRERQVNFPPGNWIDWWNGEEYKGNQTATVAAPLEKLPLYIREGAIIPMLRPTIQTISPTEEPERVDSYATTPGVLYARIIASENASLFTLFDGTLLKQERKSEGLTLYYKQGEEFKHGVMFELFAEKDSPSQATANGKELEEKSSIGELEQSEEGWFYDKENGGILWIKAAAGEQEIIVK